MDNTLYRRGVDSILHHCLTHEEAKLVLNDFHDFNHACPKDNFPTPFIDQILDECASSEVFSFMDGFSGYNQIQIKPEDQHKSTFICP